MGQIEAQGFSGKGNSVFRIIISIVSYFAGLGIAFILNFVIEGNLIPDPCAYHGEDTTKVFDLFYEMTAAEGYHPSPTLLNRGLTIILGLILGFLINKRVE